MGEEGRAGAGSGAGGGLTVPWQQEALAEIDGLSQSLADRHGWAPSITRTSDAIDLFIQMRRGGHDGDLHVLRLRYCADWQVAGRRETFVNAEDYAEECRSFWPRGISGINPDHNPAPAICLPGCWGFHSILHTDRRDIIEHPLGEILRNLQTMMG